VIADPFMGSGSLLRGVVKRVGMDNIARIWGMEFDHVACVFGYASLLDAVDNDIDVRVVCGDSFRNVWGSGAQIKDGWEADVIVTNPPFTRWESLEKSYREYLLRLVRSSGYSKYIVRNQVSLQAISLFLIDSILRERGLLLSIIPASTFYTIYGRGVKAMLREKYRVLGLFRGWEPSFSLDSGFIELVIAAIKGERGETAFVTLSDNCVESIGLSGSVVRGGCVSSYTDLGRGSGVLDMNWLLYFEESNLRPLLRVIEDLLEKGVLLSMRGAYGKDLIMRGIEIYGPNFFTIPNRFWRIADRGGDTIVIEKIDSGEQLSIPRDYLVEALRRPGLYVDRILVEDPEYYMVSIPPKDPKKLPQDVRKYIEWGSRSRVATSARRAFGSRWYSHVNRQIASKNPFGKLFLPDKVDIRLKNRGVFAIASTRPISATKNFYILVLSDRLAPLLTLWFNSSIFLALLIYGGRRIGETWTRLLIEDYLELPVPSPRVCEDHYEEAEDLLRSIGREPLPPIPSQIGGKQRISIDTLVFEALGVKGGEELRSHIYNTLSRFFEASSNIRYNEA
ncbi:MAG TPA: N-6 DNA methylase, partial [Sulfolobales archaeon]|nr:N-6 DNA methylase [Sulfolobales archaeon]